VPYQTLPNAPEPMVYLKVKSLFPTLPLFDLVGLSELKFELLGLGEAVYVASLP
jgi:hypothetical protein